MGVAVPADHPVLRAVRRARATPASATAAARRSPRSTASDITQAEWDAAHQREVERICASRCPNIDAEAARLARRRATRRSSAWCATACWRGRRQVEPGRQRRAAARELFAERPAVASLRKPGRQLDMERYRLLAAAGHDARRCSTQRVRQDLATRQVLQGVGGTALAPDGGGRRVARRLLRAARSAGRALRHRPTSRQGQADRRRPRGLLQGQRSAVPGARAGAASNTWCSTWTRVKKGITVNEADLQDLLRAERARASPAPKSAAPATS